MYFIIIMAKSSEYSIEKPLQTILEFFSVKDHMHIKKVCTKMQADDLLQITAAIRTLTDLKKTVSLTDLDLIIQKVSKYKHKKNEKVASKDWEHLFYFIKVFSNLPLKIIFNIPPKIIEKFYLWLSPSPENEDSVVKLLRAVISSSEQDFDNNLNLLVNFIGYTNLSALQEDKAKAKAKAEQMSKISVILNKMEEVNNKLLQALFTTEDNQASEHVVDKLFKLKNTNINILMLINNTVTFNAGLDIVYKLFSEIMNDNEADATNNLKIINNAIHYIYNYDKKINEIQEIVELVFFTSSLIPKKSFNHVLRYLNYNKNDNKIILEIINNSQKYSYLMLDGKINPIFLYHLAQTPKATINILDEKYSAILTSEYCYGVSIVGLEHYDHNIPYLTSFLQELDIYIQELKKKNPQLKVTTPFITNDILPNLPITPNDPEYIKIFAQITVLLHNYTGKAVIVTSAYNIYKDLIASGKDIKEKISVFEDILAYRELVSHDTVFQVAKLDLYQMQTLKHLLQDLATSDRIDKDYIAKILPSLRSNQDICRNLVCTMLHKRLLELGFNANKYLKSIESFQIAKNITFISELLKTDNQKNAAISLAITQPAGEKNFALLLKTINSNPQTKAKEFIELFNNVILNNFNLENNVHIVTLVNKFLRYINDKENFTAFAKGNDTYREKIMYQLMLDNSSSIAKVFNHNLTNMIADFYIKYNSDLPLDLPITLNTSTITSNQFHKLDQCLSAYFQTTDVECEIILNKDHTTDGECESILNKNQTTAGECGIILNKDQIMEIVRIIKANNFTAIHYQRFGELIRILFRKLQSETSLNTDPALLNAIFKHCTDLLNHTYQDKDREQKYTDYAEKLDHIIKENLDNQQSLCQALSKSRYDWGAKQQQSNPMAEGSTDKPYYTTSMAHVALAIYIPEITLLSTPFLLQHATAISKLHACLQENIPLLTCIKQWVKIEHNNTSIKNGLAEIIEQITSSIINPPQQILDMNMIQQKIKELTKNSSGKITNKLLSIFSNNQESKTKLATQKNATKLEDQLTNPDSPETKLAEHKSIIQDILKVFAQSSPEEINEINKECEKIQRQDILVKTSQVLNEMQKIIPPNLANFKLIISKFSQYQPNNANDNVNYNSNNFPQLIQSFYPLVPIDKIINTSQQAINTFKCNLENVHKMGKFVKYYNRKHSYLTNSDNKNLINPQIHINLMLSILHYYPSAFDKIIILTTEELIFLFQLLSRKPITEDKLKRSIDAINKTQICSVFLEDKNSFMEGYISEIIKSVIHKAEQNLDLQLIELLNQFKTNINDIKKIEEQEEHIKKIALILDRFNINSTLLELLIKDENLAGTLYDSMQKIFARIDEDKTLSNAQNLQAKNDSLAALQAYVEKYNNSEMIKNKLDILVSELIPAHCIPLVLKFLHYNNDKDEILGQIIADPYNQHSELKTDNQINQYFLYRLAEAPEHADWIVDKPWLATYSALIGISTQAIVYCNVLEAVLCEFAESVEQQENLLKGIKTDITPARPTIIALRIMEQYQHECESIASDLATIIVYLTNYSSNFNDDSLKSLFNNLRNPDNYNGKAFNLNLKMSYFTSILSDFAPMVANYATEIAKLSTARMKFLKDMLALYNNKACAAVQTKYNSEENRIYCRILLEQIQQNNFLNRPELIQSTLELTLISHKLFEHKFHANKYLPVISSLGLQSERIILEILYWHDLIKFKQYRQIAKQTDIPSLLYNLINNHPDKERIFSLFIDAIALHPDIMRDLSLLENLMNKFKLDSVKQSGLIIKFLADKDLVAALQKDQNRLTNLQKFISHNIQDPKPGIINSVQNKVKQCLNPDLYSKLISFYEAFTDKLPLNASDILNADTITTNELLKLTAFLNEYNRPLTTDQLQGLIITIKHDPKFNEDFFKYFGQNDSDINSKHLKQRKHENANSFFHKIYSIFSNKQQKINLPQTAQKTKYVV